MPVNIPALIQKNAARWAAMQIDPHRLAEFDRVVARLWTPATKARYQVISEGAGGVPAPFIALAHERESSGNWNRSLAQGDLLNAYSIHVPAGRIPPPARPPFTFEAAAIDALTVCDHVDKWKDWSIPGMLTALEKYNGLGNAMRGIPSAYVFSGSNQYVKGKFIRDHVFDPDHVDVQLGVAVLFARMLHQDPQLQVDFHDAGEDVRTMAPVVQQPVQTPPAAKHSTEWLQAALNTIGQHEPFRAEMLACLADVDRTLPLQVDGVYAKATKEAVRGYQRAHGGLLDDGKAGTSTIPAIEKTLAGLAPTS